MNICFRKMSLEPEIGLCDVSLSFHFHIFRIALVYLILRDVEYYGDSESLNSHLLIGITNALTVFLEAVTELLSQLYSLYYKIINLQKGKWSDISHILVSIWKSCTISVLPCRLISSALWCTSPYWLCITLIASLAKISEPTLKATGSEVVF